LVTRQLDVEGILRSIAKQRVLVVGDLMLNEYLWGEIARISPEAPVPVMHLHRSERSLGDSANVARNAASLGAGVSAIGVVGADEAGATLLDEFDRAGINRTGVLTDPSRTTTRNCRLMSEEHNRQVFRFDQESPEELSPVMEERLIGVLHEQVSTARAIICSDYLKGVLTPRVLRETAALARKHGVPLVTAPKDIQAEKYWGASVLMPNLREFARRTGHRMNGNSSGWMDPAARSLLREDMFTALLVTRGADGMTLFEQERGNLRRQDIGVFAHDVYDVTGAGDTAICVFALAIGAGTERNRAAEIANIAAGIVVGKQGTACVTPEDIRREVHAKDESQSSMESLSGFSATTPSGFELS
jgi:rfaE bifunctional protein kinase chain/domain